MKSRAKCRMQSRTSVRQISRLTRSSTYPLNVLATTQKLSPPGSSYKRIFSCCRDAILSLERHVPFRNSVVLMNECKYLARRGTDKLAIERRRRAGQVRTNLPEQIRIGGCSCLARPAVFGARKTSYFSIHVRA